MVKLLLRNVLRKSVPVSGFTLLELIAVIVIAGILSSIAAASYQALQNTRRINNTQSEIFSAIKEAQSRAKKDKITYQVSIRRNPTGSREIQLGVHNAKFLSGPNTGQIRNDVDNWNWQPIVSDLKDSQRILVGATGGSVSTISGQRIICIRFNPDGSLDLGGGCIRFNNRYIVVKGQQSSGANQKLRCIRTTSVLGSVTSFKQGEASCNDLAPSNFL